VDKKAALLAVVLAVVGLLALLWPVVSGHRLQGDMSETSQEFLEEADQPYPELLADLREYNERIYAERQAELADAAACEEPAVELRDYGVEDEVIGCWRSLHWSWSCRFTWAHLIRILPQEPPCWETLRHPLAA